MAIFRHLIMWFPRKRMMEAAGTYFRRKECAKGRVSFLRVVFLEAQRISRLADLTMKWEGRLYSGIENYSDIWPGTAPEEPPCTLIELFPQDFSLLWVGPHITLPQVWGHVETVPRRNDWWTMGSSFCPGQPSLNFQEFESKIDGCCFVSCSPSVYELGHELMRVGIVRPDWIQKYLSILWRAD